MIDIKSCVMETTPLNFLCGEIASYIKLYNISVSFSYLIDLIMCQKQIFCFFFIMGNFYICILIYCLASNFHLEFNFANFSLVNLHEIHVTNILHAFLWNSNLQKCLTIENYLLNSIFLIRIIYVCPLVKIIYCWNKYV